ncbi:hypothetical protein AX17_002563 [Amanita inopinata Kibby_2008]|nr:hypothetical protein AX17_002563 [Amanita inopinata Kibby_2008]
MRTNDYPVLFSPGMNLSRLRSLVTSGYWERLHPDAVVPWHQLWHLEFSVPIPFSVFLDALRQATSLEQCEIRIAASSETSWHRQAGTITLPNLDLLALKFANGGDVRPFLGLSVMPNLTTLEVYSETSPLDCDEMAFVETIRRSGSMKRLKTLKLKDIVVDMTALRRSTPH